MTTHVNEIRLVGRLGASVVERELPSGTVLTSFSVIIDRPAREIHGRTRVDTISCQTSRAAIATRLGKVEPGSVVEVQGALRRRFWRAGTGLSSATEVDVARLRMIKGGSLDAAR